MADSNATRALLKSRYRHSDNYAGTAAQLVACGLVRPDQFPGQPGRGKVTATYFLSDGEPTRPGCSSYEPTFSVQRVSSARFDVRVEVSEQEAMRRKTLPHDGHWNLPLDLPEAPQTTLDCDSTPKWAPTGFVLRRVRKYDFVFESDTAALAASDVLDDRPLPALSEERPKTVRFTSSRYGEVTLLQRTARTFFVVLKSPKEIRYAAYETRDYESLVYHTGTKQQLQERGYGVGVGFPGEPGCKRRKVTLPGATEAWIELMGVHAWCGDTPRYELVIRRSEAEQAAYKKASAAAEDEKARLERLKTMAATPEEFRDNLASMFWAWAGVTKDRMQSQDGYRFTSDVVDEFTESIEEAYWTIKNGETTGVSPKKKLQQVMSQKAKADEPLQRFLANLSSTASD